MQGKFTGEDAADADDNDDMSADEDDDDDMSADAADSDDGEEFKVLYILFEEFKALYILQMKTMSATVSETSVHDSLQHGRLFSSLE